MNRKTIPPARTTTPALPSVTLVAASSVELDAASSQEFGRARSPGYGLQVDIAKHDWDAPARVGRLVHDALFPDEPDFSFNVEFARGDGDAYTDPTSIWFNAFMGYYEIKVPKETWHRPFGYRFEAGGTRIAPDDLLRIGRADWNYFSAYLYGVPFSVVDASARQGGMLYHLGRTEGLRSWDLVELDGRIGLSMELVDGETLAARLSGGRSLPMPHVERLARDLPHRRRTPAAFAPM